MSHTLRIPDELRDRLFPDAQAAIAGDRETEGRETRLIGAGGRPLPPPARDAGTTSSRGGT